MKEPSRYYNLFKEESKTQINIQTSGMWEKFFLPDGTGVKLSLMFGLCLYESHRKHIPET